MSGSSEPAGPGKAASTRGGHAPTPLPEAWESRSVDEIRESILRPIMRAACGVGLLAIVAVVAAPTPFNEPGMVLGAVASLGIFALTFLPAKRPVLSLVYPWTLVLLGGALLPLMGPDTAAMMLVAGGLFIGSLVLTTRGLLILGAAAILAGAAAVVGNPHASTSEEVAQWTHGGSAMASVVVPAAIAGRLLVRWLSKTLRHRELLLQDLEAERRALRSTLHQLEQTRTQLTHAQKVELIGQMAGGIAHDMNNALTTVMGHASLLGADHPEERDAILGAASYAAQLTRQLMVFGRQDVSQPRPIDLGSTVESFLQSVRRMVPSDITLETELSNQPLTVVADPTQVLQVLLNLASNARDAMVGGGKLRIVVRADEPTKKARLLVSDTGAGIPEDQLAKIFDPFFTTKPPGSGTGLGLSSVWEIVVGMGGTVRAESTVGMGTTFIIELPLSSERVHADATPVVSVPHGSGTVLVVDDDVRVRAVAFTALQRAGYRVLEAASRRAALDVARNEAGHIDLLLTDVVMAGGGGAEVIEAFRREFPETRVLVMSGYNDDEALRRGVARGKYPFIAKPFMADELARAVAEALTATPALDP